MMTISVFPTRTGAAAALALALSTAALAAGKPAPGSGFPLSTPAGSTTEPAQQYSVGQDWLVKRYRQIERDLNGAVDLPKVRVVFVGDSITQMWQGWDGLSDTPLWPETFGRPGTRNYGLNLGVAGDRTENVLLRLLPARAGGFGELDNPQIQPEIIVFMCGINNVGHTDEPVVDKVVAGDVAVIERLRQLRPNAHILVQSILPTNRPGDADRYIKPINARLAAEVRQLGPEVGWLDLYPDFVGPDGLQDPALFRDGYHPTIKGYQVWRARLLPALESIRTSRSAGNNKGNS